MSIPRVTCLDDARRDAVRSHHLCGIDRVEVEDDGLTLVAWFLGKAPRHLGPENLRIVGGDRIRDLRVVDVRVRRTRYPDRDEFMEVRVDRTGDFSPYVLGVVEAVDGRPTDRPREDFDIVFSSAEFRFRLDCSSDLDCVEESVCPVEPIGEPSIDYLAKDFASFRQLILDRLSLVLPDWRERHLPDVGIALVEALAYVGDHLSYYQDAVATEAYLQTARQRISVRRHARLVDYAMHEGCNARAWVTVLTDTDVSVKPRRVSFVTRVDGLPANKVLTWNDLASIPEDRYEVFEPMDRRRARIELYPARNAIHLYTWGNTECCIERGATSAVLVDVTSVADQPEHPEVAAHQPDDEPSELQLRVGDVIVFEEVIGPETGDPADADPEHMQAVRLTRIDRLKDRLTGQSLLSVEWDPADALTFPLCLSAIAGEDCRLITDVSVARGNVILVDHGRRREGLPLGTVPERERTQACEGTGLPGDLTLVPGSFRPIVRDGPLTFAEPVRGGPVAGLLTQDPRSARPQIWLASSTPAADDGTGTTHLPGETEPVRWSARRDLVDSTADDPEFVVEIDDDGWARIRFGDGDLGRQPEAGASFLTTYRIGNGLAGTVGAEAIAHMVGRDPVDGASVTIRNPMPAVGGVDPETVAEVKLFAPTAYRRELRRAVIAEDYARLADGEPGVQRAAATLRWTGSWYESFVAVDPLGSEDLDERLRGTIERNLARCRRMGQDLEVRGAIHVPLDIAISVCVQPDAVRGHVERLLLDVFSDRVPATGRPGFFHPDNLTFGTGVAMSNLVAAAMGVDGVQSARVTRLHRMFVGRNRELETGLLPIGPLEIARVDNDPNHPERGRLRLKVRGGR